MSLFPFDVKHSSMLDGPTGYANTIPELRSLIELVCEVCRHRGWAKPIVTCFGRFAEDNAALYFPGLFAKHRRRLTDRDARELAKKEAAARFSWHLLGRIGPDGLAMVPRVRAVDFRTMDGLRVVLDPLQCYEIITQVRGRFPGPLEALHHHIPGGAEHLHFALPDPLGRPLKWLSREEAEVMA